jgi:hypothetical protein
MSIDTQNLTILADEIAEMGPTVVLDTETVRNLEALAHEQSTARALALRLRLDEDRTRAMLDDLLAGLHRAITAPDEDHARFVTELSLLGSVLTDRSDAQITTTFEALRS